MTDQTVPHSNAENKAVPIIQQSFRPPAWIDQISIPTLMTWHEDRIRLMLKNLCGSCHGPRDREYIEKWCPSYGAEILKRLDNDRAEHMRKEQEKLEEAQKAAARAAEQAEVAKVSAPRIVAPPKTFAEKAQIVSNKFQSGQISAAECTREIEALNKEELEELAAIRSIALSSTVPTPAIPQSVPLLPISTRAQLEMKFEQRGRLLMSQHMRGEIDSNELASKLKALRQETKFWLEQVAPPKKEKRTS